MTWGALDGYPVDVQAEMIGFVASEVANGEGRKDQGHRRG